MNAYDVVAGAFHRRIELIAGTVDRLAPGLAAASDAIAATALGDRRLFVAATGIDADLASYAASLLRGEHGGLPPLPAIALTGPEGESGVDAVWRDLRTVARDSDTLLFLDSSSGAGAGRDIVTRATRRNLSALLLSEAEELPAPAVALPLPADNAEERRELAIMAVHSLQHLLLNTLMGES